jgi:hypothetical protein
MARTFASNINTRRLQLDMTYEDVYARLSDCLRLRTRCAASDFVRRGCWAPLFLPENYA